MESIKEVIMALDRDYAIVCPPASEADIERVNIKLQEIDLELGELPSGLVEFFKICGGVQYNGVSIRGTHNDSIIRHNEDQHCYYDLPHLLFFGSVDDDIYTYNYESKQYESRDINGMECWELYDSFEEFFSSEISHPFT